MPEVARKKYLPVLFIAVAVLLICGIAWLWYYREDLPVVPLRLIFIGIVAFAGLYLWYSDKRFKAQLELQRRSLEETNSELEARHQRQARELQLSYRNYQELVESANSIILRWGPDGVIRYANTYALEFFGYSEEDFVGKGVMETIVPETESTGRDLAGMIADIGHHPENYVQNENENICSDHRRVWVAWTNKVITDDAGQTVEILSIGNDVTDKKNYERQIHQMAHYDGLTELPNRELFVNRLKQALAEANRYQREFPVFYIDLDRFKPVNDSLGHHAGDLLLQQLAARLLACLRETDTLARMGGDEFTVILESEANWEKAEKSAREVADKLLLVMSKPFDLNGREVYLSGSIGIVICPHDGASPNELLKNADTSMYHAKRQGKNCYRFYQPGMSSQAMARLELENELRIALADDLLELYYQPAINLATGHVDYVEALLRWNHPALGSIAPAKFVEIAEECGLMVQLGRWVLETAVKQAAEWHKQGYRLRMAVNVSLRQFDSPDLVADLSRVLADYGLPPECLALEITESTVMQNTEHTRRILGLISEMGIPLLIDDFGTGYSSLARLRSLPIQGIKIDRSFVFDIEDEGQHSTQIVDAIIAMTHNLDLQVIAEGVETEQQFQHLKTQQCDFVQGFLISEALPALELAPVLNSQHLFSEGSGDIL